MKAASSGRRATSNRLLQCATLILLSLTVYGVFLRAEGDFYRWREERRVTTLLQVVNARQTKHFQVSRGYAPSFAALGIDVPPGMQASMLAAPMEGRPGFIAEVCLSERCWLTNASGELRVRSLESLPPAPTPETAVAAVVAGPSREEGDVSPKGGARPAETDAAAEAAKVPLRTVVVPKGDPTAFGLPAGAELPPLSPTRDSLALWGPIEEVRR